MLPCSDSLLRRTTRFRIRGTDCDLVGQPAEKVQSDGNGWTGREAARYADIDLVQSRISWRITKEASFR